MFAPAPPAGEDAARSMTGSRMFPRTSPAVPPATATAKHHSATTTSRRACIRWLNTTVSARMRRVNEALRAVLSEAIPELKDPRVGFVTVTGVETTSDLKHATVYVSVLGSERRSAPARWTAWRRRTGCSRAGSDGSCG